MVFVSIKPVPKPRMVKSSAWSGSKAVSDYFAFKDELRLKYKTELKGKVELVFYMPIAKSTPDKRRKAMLDLPHQQRPDIDNLIKAVLDALCDDDSHIYEICASKFWSSKPGINISTED